MPHERDYHHGNLRATILATSLKLIEKKGIEALTLREIGRLAGVSRTAAYRHFADKAALLGAVSEAGFAEFGAALDDARAAAGPYFEDRLRALGCAYLHFAATHPAHYNVMFHWASQPGRQGEGPASWHLAARRSFEILGETIAEGQAQGKVRAGEPSDLARIVWASTHGLALLNLEPGDAAGAKLPALLMDVMLRGLRPAP